MNAIDKITELARAQIGVSEDANGHVKYSDEYGLPGQPWCMMFLWWLHKHTGLGEFFYDGKKTASCGALLRWAESKGYVVKDGRRGDIVIWTFRKNKDGKPETSHCGWVTQRGLLSTTSIEGNTCAIGSQDNGGHVMEQTRRQKYVLAYIRLPYDKEVVEDTIMYVVKRGDTLWKISQKFYGTGKRWREIYNFNELTSTTLQINQVLYIRKEG